MSSDFFKKPCSDAVKSVARWSLGKTLLGSVGALAVLVAVVWAWVSVVTVQAGYVGVRVNLYADKGVQNETVGTGRYFLGINEQLYRFPTFNQLRNYEMPFVFQTSDAMDIRAQVGVEYNINPDKAATVFATYRKGIEEICGKTKLLRVKRKLRS